LHVTQHVQGKSYPFTPSRVDRGRCNKWWTRGRDSFQTATTVHGSILFFVRCPYCSCAAGWLCHAVFCRTNNQPHITWDHDHFQANDH